MLDNIEELRDYKRYLNSLQVILDKFFEDQKEYICCKKGCSYCCETGAYPFSKIEFDYLTMGFFQLAPDVRDEVINRMIDLKEEYNKLPEGQKFLHRCPFLGNDGVCTVYEYRGIICRTFGLLHSTGDHSLDMPFCQEKGLNYSKIYDEKTGKFSEELIKKHGYKNYPKKFPISLRDITNKDIFGDISIDFGEIKPLIKWL